MKMLWNTVKNRVFESIVGRVVLGFVVTWLLLIAVALFSVSSQSQLLRTLSLFSNETTPSVMASNDLLLSVLSGNKTVMQHNSLSKPADLKLAVEQLNRARQRYTQLRQTVVERLSPYPALLELFEEASQHAKKSFTLGEEHLAVHEQKLALIEQETRAFEHFSREWLLFSGDMDELRQAFEEMGKRSAIWNIDTIVEKSGSASTYLNQVLGIRSVERLDEIKVTLTSLITPIKDKAKVMNMLYEEQGKKIQSYVDLIEEITFSERGVLPLHRKQLETSLKSKNLLYEINNAINQSQQLLESIIERLSDKATQSAEASIQMGGQLQKGMFLLVGFSTLVALLIAWSVTRGIRQPMTETVETLSRLSNGDLTGHSSLKQQTGEFASISDSVQRLIRTFNGLIGDIIRASGQVESAVKQTERLGHNIEARAGEQRQHTQSLAAAVTEMEASSEVVAASALESKNKASEADAVTSNNEKQVADNLAGIAQLDEEISKATAIINTVHQHTESISKIVDVIDGISGQTNLLALNAAIEAARAGELGRGFAVVADEVRSLANRSSESTTEISRMIEALQDSAQQAVAMMQSSHHLVEHSVSDARAVSDNISELKQHMHEVVNASTVIAEAAQQQSEVNRDIARTVNQIADFAEDNSRDAELLNQHGHELHEQVQSQAALVQNFRV